MSTFFTFGCSFVKIFPPQLSQRTPKRFASEGRASPQRMHRNMDTDSTYREGLSVARGRLPFGPLDRGRGLKDVRVRRKSGTASTAFEDAARDAVERHGRAPRAGGIGPAGAVDLDDPPADPDPVAGPHPSRRAGLLRPLAHALPPFARSRWRSPWRNARRTTSFTSSGENAPTSPFCIATTRPTSSVATVSRP